MGDRKRLSGAWKRQDAEERPRAASQPRALLWLLPAIVHTSWAPGDQVVSPRGWFLIPQAAEDPEKKGHKATSTQGHGPCGRNQRAGSGLPCQCVCPQSFRVDKKTILYSHCKESRADMDRPAKKLHLLPARLYVHYHNAQTHPAIICESELLPVPVSEKLKVFTLIGIKVYKCIVAH